VRRIGVIADEVAHRVRIRANDRDRPDRLVQRQQITLVLEQHDRLAGDLPGERALRGRVKDQRRVVRRDIRVLEQAQLELDAQHAAHALVEQRLAHGSALDRLLQRRAVTVRAGQLQVDPGFERQLRRLLLVARDVVIFGELVHREIIRDDQALESERLAQHAGQQRPMRPAWNAIQLVIAVHDRGQPGDLDRHLERKDVDLAQLARGDVRGRPVHAAFAHAIADEVFTGRQYAFRPALALQAAHVGCAHLCDQVRVFAERLLNAAPARVTRDIEHRRQRVMPTDRPHLGANHPGHLLDERGVPGARHADRLREARRAERHVPAAAFLVDHRRDAEARVLNQPALDRVRQPRAVGRAQVARAADARHLPNAMPHDAGGLLLGKR